MTDTYIAGVGMIPFAKPGASDPYHLMGAAAARLALEDAGISFEALDQAYVGYVYGDSTCGQKALYELGQTAHGVIPPVAAERAIPAARSMACLALPCSETSASLRSASAWSS